MAFPMFLFKTVRLLTGNLQISHTHLANLGKFSNELVSLTISNFIYTEICAFAYIWTHIQTMCIYTPIYTKTRTHYIYTPLKTVQT